MIFADTGWFIALIDPNDGLHDRAVGWLRVLDQPVVTTKYVVLETFNALSDTAKRLRCHQAMTLLMSESDVRIAPESSDLFDKGVKFHRDRPDKTWSLTDCISFVLMTDIKITQALAFDHHFTQAGFDAMLRRDPG